MLHSKDVTKCRFPTWWIFCQVFAMLVRIGLRHSCWLWIDQLQYDLCAVTMSFLIWKLFSARKNLSGSLATPSANTSRLNILSLNPGTHIGLSLEPKSLLAQFFITQSNCLQTITIHVKDLPRRGPWVYITIWILNSCRRSFHAGTLAAINQYNNQCHIDSSGLRPSESVCHCYHVGWFRG